MSDRETIPDDGGTLEDPPTLPATRAMLRICLGADAPMVEAAQRQVACAGEEWWQETMRAVAATSAPPQLPALVPERCSVGELLRWKEAGKAWTCRSDPPDAAIRGTLVYLLATALAVDDHGASISSRSAAELVPAWLDLAEVSPEPWATALARAALALGR